MIVNERSRRLVLESGFSGQGLQSMIRTNDWRLIARVAPRSAAATVTIWKIDTEHEFHYFECCDYPIEYCRVVGARPNEVLSQISVDLSFLDVDDLASAFDSASTSDEQAIATLALGLCAGPIPDPVINARIQSAFHSRDGAVRLAAARAACAAGWTALRPAIESVAKSDPDAQVRQAASITIRSNDDSGSSDAEFP
jgi:hypothetical protein